LRIRCRIGGIAAGFKLLWRIEMVFSAGLILGGRRIQAPAESWAEGKMVSLLGCDWWVVWWLPMLAANFSTLRLKPSSTHLRHGRHLRRTTSPRSSCSSILIHQPTSTEKDSLPTHFHPPFPTQSSEATHNHLSFPSARMRRRRCGEKHTSCRPCPMPYGS
jgi:hypothetical protein